MRSLGLRVVLAVALPVTLAAALGTALLWRRTDAAVRARSRAEATDLARFVEGAFGAAEAGGPDLAPRVAHRAVGAAVRAAWAPLGPGSRLRILGRDGTVRWSRELAEEDRPHPDAARLLQVPAARTTLDEPGPWPWSPPASAGELVLPLGGEACGGCHPGQPPPRLGTLQLTLDEPELRREVAEAFLGALGYLVLLVATLAALLAAAVRQHVTARLSRLARAMRQAEAGDLAVRAPNLGRDEVGLLAAAFNGMLGRLAALQAEELEHQRALERAQVELKLQGDLAHSVEELETLYEVARTVASTLQLDEVLTRVAEVVPTRLAVPKFSVMLVNGEGQLEVLKAFPPHVGSEGMSFAPGEGVCGLAASTLKRIYVPDLATDPRFRVRPGAGARGQGSLLAVPMLRGADLLGVLNFERLRPDGFAAEELEFFTAVADQVAIAVQNARLHEQTVALTVTDPLTGVPNRRHLVAQLGAEIDRVRRFGTPLSLLMIDIDHFKRLNDTAGHRAGDEVLREVAGRLRRAIRKVDTLARYGGEEFVVLLPQVGRPQAQEVGEKLRLAVAAAPFDLGVGKEPGRVTVSVGVASLPADAPDSAKLLDCADAALYASKNGGRNAVTGYAPGMESDPGRQRGAEAQRRRTGEVPVVKVT